MPGIYKLFTAFVALIGNISLISTGEMNPAFSFIGTGLLWGYYRSLKSLPTLPRWSVGSFSLSTFLVFLLDFYSSGDIFISVAQMSLVFQTIKSFDIKDTWDPPQVFFMSLLQLIIASELTSSLSFGIVFLTFLVFIVISVLLGHFVKEGQKVFMPFLGPIALVTVVILVLTVMFFISLPRLRSSLWGKSYARSIKTTGFSDRVDFGSFGEVKLDETVAARMVLKPDLPGPHYLRGTTFDYFDGVAWYDTKKNKRRLFRITGDFHIDVPEEQQKYEAEIFLEPMDSDVIFTLRIPYMLESPGYYMRKNEAGSFFMKQKISKRFNYRLFSVDGFYNDNEYLGSYLQFPDVFGSVGRLTKNIVAEAGSDLNKAVKIRDYLLRNYRYSLYTERPQDGTSAIEHFLLNSKKGYCEHFATAMTLMLRSIDIPARLVTGFLGSQKNDLGDYYVIRQSDAHSWVEAFIGDHWVLFDPTPPIATAKKVSLMLLLDMINLNWNRYVVGFSNYDQLRMASYFRSYGRTFGGDRKIVGHKFLIISFIMSLIFVIFIFRKKLIISFARRNRISFEYVRFRKQVSKKGGDVISSSTSDDVLREALKTGKFNSNDVEKFIDIYRVLRFSGKTGPGVLQDYFDASKRLK